MVKVFTLNRNGKIELTKEELQKLLDEAYWDGYRTNNYVWCSPISYPSYTTITCDTATTATTAKTTKLNDTSTSGNFRDSDAWGSDSTTASAVSITYGEKNVSSN